MSRRSVRVFIVEDSAVTQRLIIRLLERVGGFEVVGAAANGLDAVQEVGALRPDVVTMDIHLPGIDGLEATRRIMRQFPTPILVVSGSSHVTDRTLFDVLEAGALGIALRPLSPGWPGAEERQQRLVGELRTIAAVALSARRERTKRPLIEPPAAGGDGASPTPRRQAPIDMIGIAASTGGPAALRQLVNDMPPPLPPILIVQHISPGFVDGFADWLSDMVPSRVTVATDGELARPDRILLAPDDRHLKVGRDGRVHLVEDPPVNGHRPSADVLFASIAQVYQEAGLGVVLTGMGRDGAAGLEAIHRAGGITLAQDQATSVVYGMPAVAARRGVAQVVLPIDRLGSMIGMLLKQNATKTQLQPGRGGNG